MAWQAKPSGGYIYNSTEGLANIAEMDAYFSGEGFTKEAIAGICGNSYAESALNPWRWQSDTYNLSGGYGLFQYTPASGYINDCSHLQGYAPNMSTSIQTAGADPGDGLAQCIAFRQNTLAKWQMLCWRPYWAPATYPTEYAYRTQVLNEYGSGNRITLDQFSQIDDITAATFVFLACFEGPAELHLSDRVYWAERIYPYITGGGGQIDDAVLTNLLVLRKKRKGRGFYIY